MGQLGPEWKWEGNLRRLVRHHDDCRWAGTFSHNWTTCEELLEREREAAAYGKDD